MTHLNQHARTPRPARIGHGRWVFALAVVGLCLMHVGCGPKNFLNENDTLRAENLKLNREVEELNKQMELRLGEIKALRAQASDKQAIKEATPPILVKLTFERYSGALDTDSDKKDDLVRIYLQPLDQHGRVLPVAGRLKMQIVAILADAPPSLLTERTYEPDEFDAAYRTSFMSYHYTIDLPLPESIDPEITSVTVKAFFTDAITGNELTYEQIFPISVE